MWLAGIVPAVRAPVVGDVAATLQALAPMIEDKHPDHFLREHVKQTEHAAAGGLRSPDER